MSFNFTAKFGADGTGYFNELRKIEDRSLKSEAMLNRELKRRADERLTPLEKEKKLRAEIAKLTNEVASFKPKSEVDVMGRERAAQMKLELLRKQEQLEGLVTKRKQTQAALDAEAVAAAKAKQAASFGGRLKAGAEDVSRDVLSGFGAPLGIAAAAGSMIEAYKSALDYASGLKDSSEQAGLTTMEVQKLGKAARATGLSFDDFGQALSQLDVHRREAAEGNEEMQAVFHRFGISLEELNSPALRHIDLLKKITAGTKEMDSATRLQLRDLLGRRGDKLGAALELVPGIKDENLISDAAIQRLDEAEKRLAAIGSEIRKNNVLAADWLNTMVEATAMGLINPDNVNQTGGLTREAIARRGHELNVNAGLSPEQETGDAALFQKWMVARGQAQTRREELQSSLNGESDPARRLQIEREITAQLALENQNFDQFATAQSGREQERLFTNKKNKQLDDDIAEIIRKRGMIGLTNAEKELRIKEEIRQMEEDIALIVNETEQKKAQKALEEKRNQLLELEAKPEATRSAPERSVDSLARVGLFLGGSPAGVNVQPFSAREADRHFTLLVQAVKDAAARQVAAIEPLIPALREGGLA